MKKASFITYKNKKESLVQVELLVDYDYKELLSKDLDKVKSFTAENIYEIATINNIDCTLQDCQDALTGTTHGRTGLITSFEKTLNDDSPKESNYTDHPSLKGVKVSKTTGGLYCIGIILKETILEQLVDPAPKKPVNSGIVVQLKNLVSKIAQFNTDKIRTYSLDLDKIDSYSLQDLL